MLRPARKCHLSSGHLGIKWNFDMLNIAICFAWRGCIKRTYSDHTRFSAFEIPELMINSLWPSDAIWQYKDWSLLLKVMACRLTTQYPALPAPLLTYINRELWLSLDKNLAGNAENMNKKMSFKKYTVEITAVSLRGKLIERGTLLKECVFTRGQFWPPGIVVACVCLSVCPFVRPSVCAVITCLSAR